MVPEIRSKPQTSHERHPVPGGAGRSARRKRRLTVEYWPVVSHHPTVRPARIGRASHPGNLRPSARWLDDSVRGSINCGGSDPKPLAQCRVEPLEGSVDPSPSAKPVLDSSPRWELLVGQEPPGATAPQDVEDRVEDRRKLYISWVVLACWETRDGVRCTPVGRRTTRLCISFS